MKRFALFLLFLSVILSGFADNYYVDPFPKSKMPATLVFEGSGSYTGTITGVVKRIIQFGDTTVVLSNFADAQNKNFAHLKLFTIDKQADRYLSTNGISDADNSTNNVYRKISDIARTSDGKLVACNYVLTHMPNATIGEGYVSGAFCVWRWDNLEVSPTKWFRSETACYFRTETGTAMIGWSMAVNGTVDNCLIYATAADAKTETSSMRIAKFDVNRAGDITLSGALDSEGKPIVGLTGFTQMVQSGNSSNTLVSTQKLGYTPYQLSLSPRGEDNMIFTGPSFKHKEFQCLTGASAPVNELDQFTATDYIYDKNLTNASYFNYGAKSFMVMPYINTSNQVVGVKVYDITTGLASPVLLSTINLASPVSAVYASADMVFRGTDMNVYLHVISESIGENSTITIYRFTNAESASLFNPDYTRPAELKNTNCVVRVAEGDVKNSLPEMKVDYLASGYNSLAGFGDICLYATDDADYAVKAANLTHVYTITNPTQGTNYSLTPVASDFVMKPGKRYSFCSSYVPLKAFRFDVCVVPNTVVWSPVAGSREWHNDANWQTQSGANAYIPLAETNVVLPKNKTVVLPIDKNSLSAEATDNLVYNVGVDYNKCNGIYFAEGAKLVNQQYLEYTDVCVDMPFKHNDGTFELKSVPVNGVVSGDFYIPKSGDKATFDFAELAAVDTRVANSFRQKTFNVAVTQHAGTEQNVVKCETSTWSEPTNALNMPWQVGRGYAISKKTTTIAQDYVRLPKSATSYCFYYDNNGQEGELHFTATTIERGANPGKLSFQNDVTITLTNDNEGQIFLVGNPFICDMSISKFFDANANIEKSFYYTYIDNVLEVQFVQGDDSYLVAPTEAIFVKTINPTKTLDVAFKVNMMYNSVAQQAQASMRRAKEFDEVLTITAKRNDKISKTNIKLTSNATTQYSVGEDVPLLLLDPELTPFAIYSIVDSQAVAYNTVDDIYMIPLSINVIDGEEMGDITFEFSGVDNLSQFVYLYDSYEDRYISLDEGDIFNYNVEENQAVRYYITSRRIGETPTDLDESMIETVKILNFGEGQLMVYASENIISLNVYDLTGKLIVSETNINAPQHNITLPQNNVYMFEVITESTVSNQKIATK